MSTQRRGIVYIYPHRHYPIQMARTAAKRQISSAEAVAQQQRNKQAERLKREALQRERKIASYLSEDDNFPSFAVQLAKHGLQLRDIPGDGNCLFRALGDQLEGHGRSHYKHRLAVANFMYQHRKDFEPFVEDNISFENHVSNLKQLGTYAGNDAIVAFARLNGVNIVIHQLAAPFLEIHGSSNPNARQLHIAYHNGDHYSSVRKFNDGTESPANIRLQIGETPECKQNPVKTEGYSPAYNGYHNGDQYHQSVLYSTGDGIARVLRDESSVEQQVMAATGCQDIETVRQSLCENDFDVETAITDVFQLMEISNKSESASVSSKVSAADSGIWSENGTGSRVICSTTGPSHPVNLGHSRDNSIASSGYGSLNSNHGGARPKNPGKNNNLSGRQKRDQKKFEKKKRAEERHRQKVLGENISAASDEEMDRPDVITIPAQEAAIIRG